LGLAPSAVNKAGSRRNRVIWYDFASAPKLLEDFWNDVQRLLKEEGVPWME
jgi:hypothetical protein